MVAALLGKPLMEWQQYVADVILEVDPATGRLVYDQYVITVPRQSGKTTFILAKLAHRCSAGKFFGSRQQMVYLAQTRSKAREQLEERFAPDLKASARFKQTVLHLGNGNEHLRFPNGSRFAIEANTEKAGHGGTLDEALIDEAFSAVDNRSEQALRPAMITRPNKQLGVVSTMGWSDASPYFMAKVLAGRSLVEQQISEPSARRGTFYAEWSAPDDAEVGDEQVWLDCMPAVHRPDCDPDCVKHTITLDAIRAEYDDARRSGKLKDFQRAYLNQAVSKPREGEETALGNWLACGRDVSPDELSAPRAVGVAVAMDRSWSSLCSVVHLPDGTPFLVPVRNGRRPGTDWVAAEAARISLEHRIPAVVDEGGTAGVAMVEAISQAGGEAVGIKLAGYVTACADLYDRVQRQTVAHAKNPDLNDSVAGARWRPCGDGRRVFGRKASQSDVSMLEAATLALWGSEQGRSVYDKREVRFL